MPAPDRFISQIEAELTREREDLAALKSGQIHIGERSGNGPWRDTTQAWIDQHKRIIATYEAILNAEKKRQAS
jgi:hypothetical protein